MLIVFRNFYRNKMVNLTAQCVKHFLPDAELYCLTLCKYDMSEYDNQEPLLPYISEFTAKTKYVNGKDNHDDKDASKTSGFAAPDNGAIFAEGYNLIFDKFKDYDKPILMLTEDHFFTTGETLKELSETDWDIAWARWDYGANGSILGIIPTKVAHCFPVAEHRNTMIEYVVKQLIVDKVNTDRQHRITTRDQLDYKGDGFYTNSSEIIKEELEKLGIL